MVWSQNRLVLRVRHGLGTMQNRILQNDVPNIAVMHDRLSHVEFFNLKLFMRKIFAISESEMYTLLIWFYWPFQHILFLKSWSKDEESILIDMKGNGWRAVLKFIKGSCLYMAKVLLSSSVGNALLMQPKTPTCFQGLSPLYGINKGSQGEGIW